MKSIIYPVILVLILSCNTKAENIKMNGSKKENTKFSENTLTKTGVNLDSISKVKSKKEIKASLDTTSIVTNDALEINKQLNGVWNVIEIFPSKPDNIINIFYFFDAKKKRLEVYLGNELRELYTYEIVTTDCEGNNNSDFCYIKLSGDDNYCSRIVTLKHSKNKTYFILKDFIGDYNKEFLKLSDDPDFIPKGFK